MTVLWWVGLVSMKSVSIAYGHGFESSQLQVYNDNGECREDICRSGQETLTANVLGLRLVNKSKWVSRLHCQSVKIGGDLCRMMMTWDRMRKMFPWCYVFIRMENKYESNGVIIPIMGVLYCRKMERRRQTSLLVTHLLSLTNHQLGEHGWCALGFMVCCAL